MKPWIRWLTGNAGTEQTLVWRTKEDFDCMATSGALAKRLVDARVRRSRLVNVPVNEEPGSVAAAYAVQREFILRYGESVGGWKIAGTSEAMRKYYKFDEPYFGPIFASDIFPSATQMLARNYLPFGIECELAIIMGEELGAHQQVVDSAEIEKLIKGVAPAVEIVTSRYLHWEGLALPLYIADCASNGGLVLGDAAPFRDIGDIARLRARLEMSGNTVAKGCASTVLGHPLNALEWLLNTRHRSFSLRGGDVICLGSMTGMRMAAVGDRIKADFGVLGVLEIDVC